MALIYKIENSINNKIYIGKTTRSFNERKREHCKDYKTKDTLLYRAMRKYGLENFQFEIIEDNIPNEEISAKEKEYIKKYNSYYEGYNMTFGGEGESKVDFSIIEKLFLEGNNCTEIEKITGHTRKTISNLLKNNGYMIFNNHTGLNKDNKNGTEVKVIFEEKVYNSISELALFLKNNFDDFKDKKKSTIIQGISRCLKSNNKYCGYYFYLFK